MGLNYPCEHGVNFLSYSAIMIATHLTLWGKIEQFPIDDGAAAIPFSARLAKEQHRTSKFTQRAILEYKGFVFLCCVLDKGASKKTWPTSSLVKTGQCKRLLSTS